MASRFVVADNDVIEELKTSSENLYTRKSTHLWVGVIKKMGSIKEHLWRSVTDNIMKVVDIISKPKLKCQNSQYKYETFQIISSRQTLYQSHGQFISKHL